MITLYPYTKTKEDEISFQKGMVINVMSKDDGDWWKGELNGAVGYFPSNYVQELKDSGRSVPSDDCKLPFFLLFCHLSICSSKGKFMIGMPVFGGWKWGEDTSTHSFSVALRFTHTLSLHSLPFL